MTLDRGGEPRDHPDAAGSSCEPLPATLGSGRYAIESLIGCGGSGEVYRARDRRLGRVVALKVFPPGVAEAEDVRRWREVRTLAGLDHDRLVRIYDVGEHDTRPFFVMQLVEGDNLQVRLRTSTYDVPGMLRLGVGVASGLAHVHAHGVVHRDVKPANVLLDGNGDAYLTDFGIATRIGAAAITEAGVVLGTAPYLAPEQVRGEPVGAAADVYSLGLVLMEAFSGRREYPGEVVESATARLHRRPEPPADLPDDVAELLRAMTADDPAARPGALAVATRLEALVRRHAHPEPPATPVPAPRPRSVVRGRPRRPRARSGRLGWAVSAVLAVLLGLVGAAVTQSTGTPVAVGATLASPEPELPSPAAALPAWMTEPRTSRAAPVVPVTEGATHPGVTITGRAPSRSTSATSTPSRTTSPTSEPRETAEDGASAADPPTTTTTGATPTTTRTTDEPPTASSPTTSPTTTSPTATTTRHAAPASADDGVAATSARHSRIGVASGTRTVSPRSR